MKQYTTSLRTKNHNTTNHSWNYPGHVINGSLIMSTLWTCSFIYSFWWLNGAWVGGIKVNFLLSPDIRILYLLNVKEIKKF